MKQIKFSSHLVISIIAALLCGIESEKAWAVGGISNSKVIVPSADTVEKGRFEIEPFFSFTKVDDPIDTKVFQAGGRFTLGLLDNLEIGTNVNYLVVEDSDVTDRDSHFGDIETGLKYNIFKEGEKFPFSLSYQGGVTLPTSGDDAPWVLEAGGLILTKNFTEQLSLDADFSVAFVEDESITFVSDVGFGYFVTPHFQPVVEAAYSYENPDEGDSISVVSLTAGFTAPVSEMLTIIVGATQDVHADNIDKELTISAAFTFLF